MYVNSIRVSNFMTLKDFEWKIESNFNLIYGENGSGKSTIIDIFDYLILLFRKPIIEKSFALLAEKNGFEYKDQLKALRDIYGNYSTKGFSENILVHIDFKYKNKRGMYKIELNKENEIEYEELKYVVDKKISRIFLRNKNNISFNSEIKKYFKRYEYYYDNNKNTIVSIFALLFNDKEIKYNENISLDVINHLSSCIVHNHKFHKNEFHTAIGGFLQSRYSISNDKVQEFEIVLNKTLKDFSSFVSSIDNKIVDIIYTKKISENHMDYLICTEKKIKEKSIKIPFDKESSGTQIYMEYYNMLKLMSDEEEQLFLWDEIDLHLHDNLSSKLLEYLYEHIKRADKQIIITTHNQKWLNNKKISNKEKNILGVNPFDGSRFIKNLQGEDVKDNFSKKYALGLYGGIPPKSDIYWNPFEG